MDNFQQVCTCDTSMDKEFEDLDSMLIDLRNTPLNKLSCDDFKKIKKLIDICEFKSRRATPREISILSESSKLFYKRFQAKRDGMKHSEFIKWTSVSSSQTFEELTDNEKDREFLKDLARGEDKKI